LKIVKALRFINSPCSKLSTVPRAGPASFPFPSPHVTHLYLLRARPARPMSVAKPAQPPCSASTEAVAPLLTDIGHCTMTPLQPRQSSGAHIVLRHVITPGSSIFSPFLAASTESNKISSPTRILHGNLFKS
jgi:hypothetical protein